MVSVPSADLLCFAWIMVWKGEKCFPNCTNMMGIWWVIMLLCCVAVRAQNTAMFVSPDASTSGDCTRNSPCSLASVATSQSLYSIHNNLHSFCYEIIYL